MERKEKGKAKEPQKPLKTLLLCDVDGTLLVNDRIRPEDAAALQRWKQAGNRFGLLTGRGEAFCRQLCGRLGVNPDVLITDNGAQVMLGGECVYRQWLRSSQVKAVLDKLQDAGLWPGLCVPFVTMPDGAHRFCRRRMPVAAMERMMEVQAHLTYFSEQDLEDLLAESPSVPGLSLYVWDERNTAGVLEQGRALAPEMQWHQTSHDYVEACESDKALALRALLSQMPEIPVCFAGDGPNDVPVFDMLEDAWCMDTAPDPVKAHACYVTESVAQVIERKLDYVEET